jgi:hypothetical protein
MLTETRARQIQISFTVVAETDLPLPKRPSTCSTSSRYMWYFGCREATGLSRQPPPNALKLKQQNEPPPRYHSQKMPRQQDLTIACLETQGREQSRDLRTQIFVLPNGSHNSMTMRRNNAIWPTFTTPTLKPSSWLNDDNSDGTNNYEMGPSVRNNECDLSGETSPTTPVPHIPSKHLIPPDLRRVRARTIITTNCCQFEGTDQFL